MENKNELTPVQIEEAKKELESFKAFLEETLAPILNGIIDTINSALEPFKKDSKELEGKINARMSSDYAKFVPRNNGMIANAPRVSADVYAKRATINLIKSGSYNASKITK